MPYILPELRQRLDPTWQLPGAATPGELNYQITQLCRMYLTWHSPIAYQDLNDVIGALECAKQELYRRIAVPYEDKKISQNGDVYG